MVLLLACFAAFTPKAWARYSGGTGDPNDPYRIATAADLNDIGNYEEDWDKNFVLVNDVNLAQYTGTQFNIIGRWIDWHDPNNKPFVGVFDGNDCKIWNFRWDSNGIDGVGLLEYVGSSGQIKNLGMENVDVNAVNGGYIGGLVGINYYGTISSCYSTGSVSGYAYIGGLVGYNYGTINNCYSSGSISGNARYAGGLVGGNYGTMTNCYSSGSVTGRLVDGGLVGINSYYGMITNCYSTGSVLGTSGMGGLVGESRGTIGSCYSIGSVTGTYHEVGGLVGRNYYATITNCYSAGSASGEDYVGGLVGRNYGGIITKCYSIGSVSGTIYNVGGLVGYSYGGAVSASFWDTQTSGEPNSAGGVGKTTAEMKTINIFTNAGWDFVEIWGIGENQTYPFLRNEPAGDSNHDKKVDLLDLAIFASHWLEGQ
jgi:hypothetical protein